MLLDELLQYSGEGHLVWPQVYTHCKLKMLNMHRHTHACPPTTTQTFQMLNLMSMASSASSAKKRSATKKSWTSEFKVKNMLKPPPPNNLHCPSPLWFVRCCLLLIIALTCAMLDQIHGCDINLEPDYQQGEFWATLA